jgi:alginate O-acetyltransferase complex protein AlgI
MRIYFTYWLIPAVLLALPIFWVVLRRDRWRLLFTLLVSLAALALLHPIWVVVALGITAATHQLVELLRRRKLAIGHSILLAIAIAVVTLAIGKYGHDLAHSLWRSNDWAVTHLIMPLGISYFVFRVLQYVFDQARGVLQENSLFKLATFLFFIPTVPAGPLETYQGFYDKRSTSFDRPLFYKGLRRIAWGYFKKVFIVDFSIPLVFGPLVLNAVGSSHWQGSAHKPLLAIFYAIVVFVKAYFDLSAYTDLAIGFSCLFGFRIMENFNLPFLKQNLSDFWRGWHISLSSWCRNNVYFPVYGWTRMPWLGLYASMLTMGLWHDVTLNWTFWGLYHGSGLAVYSRWSQFKKKWKKKHRKSKKKTRADKVFGLLGYPVTFLYVAFGYAFVSTSTFGHGLRIFMWCFEGPAIWLKHLVF